MHLDLHSFPTRRSSDLRGDERVSLLGSFGTATPTCSIAAWLGIHHGPARRHGCPAIARDRKSTRLNSSHVRISYVVFCLKKKNVTIIKATRQTYVIFMA